MIQDLIHKKDLIIIKVIEKYHLSLSKHSTVTAISIEKHPTTLQAI